MICIRVRGDLVQLPKRDAAADADGEEGDAGAAGASGHVGRQGVVIGGAVRHDDAHVGHVAAVTVARREHRSPQVLQSAAYKAVHFF